MLTSLPPASLSAPTGPNEVTSSDGVRFVVDRKLEVPLESGVEDAESLSAFLSYLSTAQLDPAALLPTFAMIAKYAPGEQRFAVSTLTCLLIDGAVCPLQAFMIGARVHDLQLCRLAVVHGDARTQDAMDWTQWAAVEPRYKSALERAYAAGGDPQERGNRFVEIMSLEE